jgi:lipid-binding SYLF domain-containing protein
VVRDNQTGRDIYMKMGEFGIGLGLGVKDFRAVFVFHDHATVERFITIYQLTESGLALQPTVKGTTYWRDEELN